MRQLVRKAVEQFCCEFVSSPYLCYTEHGQHSLFYSQLVSAIPEAQRYAPWREQRVCVVQKEYPTAGRLGKPKRQHWDVAVLRQPLANLPGSEPGYDFLQLESVVEFGMNEAEAHLLDDIARIAHPDSNVLYGFVVHLLRFSDAGTRFSGRDWSPTSHRITAPDTLVPIVKGKPLEVWVAVADQTATREAGVWLVQSEGSVHKIACA